MSPTLGDILEMESLKKTVMVKVRHAGPDYRSHESGFNKNYFFLSDDLTIKPGDYAVVERSGDFSVVKVIDVFPAIRRGFEKHKFIVQKVNDKLYKQRMRIKKRKAIRDKIKNIEGEQNRLAKRKLQLLGDLQNEGYVE